MSDTRKKIIYIANIRLPTEKAHGIQIMEMCSAFAKEGVKVALVVPKRFNHIKEDPFVYHDVKENFAIKRLPCIDTVKFGKIGFLFEIFSFTFFVVLRYLFTFGATFYTRDESVAFFLRVLGKKVVWEGHRGEKNIVIKLLIKMKVKMVMISNGLLDLYKRMGALPARMIVAPDAADVERFDIDISIADARKRLGLPLDKKIILYKGGMFSWKGPGTLAKAAAGIKSNNFLVVFIGGTEKDVAAFNREFSTVPNILVLGNRPRQETPVYQKAADVLIIPNSAKDDISKLYTSPMKLFGYMASGRPIVTSDLPSIREILDESNSFFFLPDDPASLAAVIDSVLNDQTEAQKRAGVALEQVRQYSWKNRAQNILKFIS
mgnify:CR=1 FL=1